MAPSPSFKRARKFSPKPQRPPLAPRLLRWVFALAAVVLMVDALFGDRGLVDTLRARQEYDALRAHVARVRADNQRLRDEARRLKEDPSAIESIARDELGLVHPGEILFVVKDASPAPVR